MKSLILIIGVVMMLSAKTQTIVLGAGCFWGVEKFFDNLEGVTRATAGYAGGNYPDPTYRQVLSQRNPDEGVINHAEVVEVLYDDTKISTRKLLEAFWELHDPTQKDRQGNDIGNNYRSAIYYTTEEQKRIAHETKEIYQKLLTKAGFGKITTEIKPLEKFYPAEAYHQNYLRKNPGGYCPNHATGVKFPNTEKQTATKPLTPLGGKEIVVIEAENCPFCEKFEKEVLSRYHGTLPLRKASAEQLRGFDLHSKIIGTPAIFFIEDARERYAHIGYLDEKAFYKMAGALKLGKESEAYDVAFNSHTDRRFCRRYERFKHTPDGVFVDRISGDILFDTKDRFDSGSGWLSFYRAVDGAVVERDDHSLGMRRTEVIAKKSGAHLGHVFDDAPGGKRRYCINATVLEFVPRERIGK